jgi:alpha/beta superfamily hydrolase
MSPDRSADRSPDRSPVPVDFTSADQAWAVAVLLHPHPDFGGDRFNVVINELYRRLPLAGISTLRFDFSSSELPIAAAQTVEVLDHAAARPLALVGYSFGADVATDVDDERIAGWFLIAPPFVDARRPRPIATDPRPKALLLAEHDQFSPPGRSSHIAEKWVNTTVGVVPGADHFLMGHAGVVADEALQWLRGLRGPFRRLRGPFGRSGPAR